MKLIKELQTLRIEMSKRGEKKIVKKIDELVALLTIYIR